MSNYEAFDLKKEQIRVLISNIYDLQKMRISVGNRLVQSIYLQLGVKPGMSPESVREALINFYSDGRDIDVLEESITGVVKKGEDGNPVRKNPATLLDLLMRDYKRITDMIADADTKAKTVKSAIKELNKGEDTLNVIRDENDVRLINSYNMLLKSEEDSVKVLEKYVKEHPMWDAFFKDIKGCGPLMTGVCLAYLDPYKAPHVSCFFKYCGLDVVQDKDEDGNMLFHAIDNDMRRVAQVWGDDGNYEYIDCEDGSVYEGEVSIACHGRRMGDTEMQPYYIVDDDGNRVYATDENGELKLKRGITYNPKLKTKLMGVLAGSFLKQKDPTYSTIYYDQRNRYANSAYYKNKSDAQKNMMAQRYMVKEFVRAMWIAWRTLEGLPVDEPYEVAKLGNRPHKYNEYQCEVARKQAENKTA